ncbi:MAG: Crp/Fnr family transcriptional regulator [Pseudodesulfovibrio sp.]
MERDGLRAAMREFPVFAGLSPEQLDRLVGQASVTRIPKKALFFTEARAAQGMHVLLTGKVKLFKMSEEGKEQTIFVFGPGEPFCLCSSFSDGRLPANLGALEDSEVLVIDPVRFEAMVREDPSILLNMMRVMARRLKDAMDMIDSLSLRQVPSRLAAYFLSREIGGRVVLDISYRELSKIIGVTPEALSRALRRMADDGLVAMDGSEILLLDHAALAAC